MTMAASTIHDKLSFNNPWKYQFQSSMTKSASTIRDNISFSHLGQYLLQPSETKSASTINGKISFKHPWKSVTMSASSISYNSSFDQPWQSQPKSCIMTIIWASIDQHIAIFQYHFQPSNVSSSSIFQPSKAATAPSILHCHLKWHSLQLSGAFLNCWKCVTLRAPMK